MVVQRRIAEQKKAIMNFIDKVLCTGGQQTKTQIVAKLVLYKNMDGRVVKEFLNYMFDAGLAEELSSGALVLTEEGNKALHDLNTEREA